MSFGGSSIIMKRILALLLVVSMAVLMLVGCGNNSLESIKEHRNEYTYEPKVIEHQTLDLYIVADSVTDNAKLTVTRQINQYTEAQFNTTLNIHYVAAADYEATVTNNISDADIVLITSEALYQNIQGHLVDLSSFLATNAYGKLCVKIAESLLDSVKEGDSVYALPNNRVVSTYKYVRINRTVAERELSLSIPKIKEFNSIEKLTVSTPAEEDTPAFTCLKDIFNAKSKDYDSNVVVFDGMYEDLAKWEAEGWIVNVISVPTVTKADALTSAFGIVASDIDADRSMQILYAINTDPYLHNLLQYGVKATNYQLTTDENGNDFVTRVTVGDSVYMMNPLYTGDIFCGYFCEELGYKPETLANGQLQNKASVADTSADD